MDAYNFQIKLNIRAHEAPLQHLAFNSEGTLLATASTQVSLFLPFPFPLLFVIYIGHGYPDICRPQRDSYAYIPPWTLPENHSFHGIQPILHPPMREFHKERHNSHIRLATNGKCVALRIHHNSFHSRRTNCCRHRHCLCCRLYDD